MSEIKYSIDGLDDAIASFNDSGSAWLGDGHDIGPYSMSSCGEAAALAQSCVDARNDVYDALGEMAYSTKAFFESAKERMARADRSSPFED